MPETNINTPRSNKSAVINMCRIVSRFGTEESYALAGLNLVQSIKAIELYEDIFTASMTGTATFKDSSSLSTLFRLDGTEDLHLIFSVFNPETQQFRTYGSETQPLVFTMYAQNHRTRITAGSERFEVKLVSAELYGAGEYKISKTYKNRFIEDIIQDIMKNGLNSNKKFSFVEKTKTPITMTIPFLTPIQAIKLLCMHGQSETQETNYLFFETLDGFQFRSIRSIIEESLNKNIPTISQTLAGTRTGRDTEKLINADEIEISAGYDSLYAMTHGFFASTTYALDILSGTCKKDVTRISDDQYKNKKLINGKYLSDATPIYPYRYGNMVNPTSKLFLIPTTENTVKTFGTKDPRIHDNMIAKTLDGRNRELLSLQLRTIRAIVSGAPELNAGKIVNIIYPPTIGAGGTKVDDIANGKYMIISSKHSILNNGHGEFLYETVFEAGTDSNAVSKRT